MSRVVGVLAFWSLVGLGYALQSHAAWSAEEAGGVSIGATLLRTLPVWLFWVPVTPLVAWLGHRFRLERGQWPRSILLHTGAAIAAAVLHALWLTSYYGITGLVPDVLGRFGEMLGMMVSARMFLDVLTYLAILGGAYAVEYHDRFRERDVRTSRLEAQLTLARLDALRMQLNPHFLFNALNAVAAEVRLQRNATAITMLAGLADLLRYALDANEEPLVPLGKELAFLERYLEIERARFADRLTVDVAVPAVLHDALVPPLLLQPLVENAMRHGIAPRDAPGRLEVRGHAMNGRLVLTVRDDGVGLRQSALSDGPGLGLANVRERLAGLYGRDHSIVVRERAGGGVEAIIDVPRTGGAR